jgi:ankyrin repeat protein
MQIRRRTKHLQKSKKRTRRLRKKHTGGAGVAFGPPRPPDPVNDVLFLRAVRDGNLDEVRRLLATGLINVDAQDELIQPQFNFNGGPNVHVGMTPLFYAVSRNMHHLPFAQQYGIVDESAKDNYYQIAELLIQHGANVNATTAEWFRGWSPIHWAAEYWNLDMVQLLMSHGANKHHRYVINPAGDEWNIVTASGIRHHQYDEDIRAHLGQISEIMSRLHEGI